MQFFTTHHITRTNPLVSVLAVLLTLAFPALSLAQSTELRALQQEFETQLVVRVKGIFSAGLAKLDEGYAAGVEREFGTTKSVGDLEGALALEAEKKRLESKGAMPENDEGAARTLVKLRGIYRAEFAKLEAQRARGLAILLPPHVAQLKQLEAELTKANRLADAKAVMDYRQGLASGDAAKAMTAVNAAPAASGAGTPPAASSSPQAPAPGGAAAPMIAGVPSGGAIEVASELQAKNDVKGLASGAIAFDAPAGDGRRGAKGVLLTNDPLTGKNGTTWAFTYVHDDSAQILEIIHPHGKGQAIIHIDRAGVGISTPESWTETGYNAGDTSRIRQTRDFKDVFPLMDDVPYDLVSKLDGQGSYELTLKGKVVATGRVNKTSPLSIEIKPGASFPGAGRGVLEFKGANLPLQWAAGYAALIVGPMDGAGAHLCRDVRFWPVAN